MLILVLRQISFCLLLYKSFSKRTDILSFLYLLAKTYFSLLICCTEMGFIVKVQCWLTDGVLGP